MLLPFKMYSPWRSPYYHYPRTRYRTNVNVHINVNNNYNRTTVRTSKNAPSLQKKNRRNDYDAKKVGKVPAKTSTGKKVQTDWKPQSQRTGKRQGR